MNAVGRLGRYISRGVYTVSGPFHPFGGCVDIIVVQQQDGSFKSSSWYVRFGKFQGVLKTREKVVNICVNGVEADFHMYLDHKGEAYFPKEVDDVEEGESVLNHSSSGDEETERPLKSQSRNLDVGDAKTLSRIDSSNGKIRRRTNSRRLQILGLVFGRRSVKESDNGGEKESDVVQRVDSLERAEFAAKLLEVKWSTNLDASKTRNDVLDDQDRRDMEIDGRISHVRSLEKNDEISTLSEIIPESECHVASNVTGHADELTTMSVAEQEENADGVFSEVVGAGLQVPMEVEVCTSKQYDEEEVSNGKEVQLELPGCGISQNGRTDSVQSFIYCESSERSIARNDASSEQTHETSYITSSGCGHLHVHAETLHARTEPLSKDTVVQQLLGDFQLEAPTVEGPTGCSEQTNNFCACTEPIVAPESYAQIIHTNPMERSGEEVEPQSLCTTSSLTNSFHQFEDEVNMKVQGSMCKSQPSSESERIEATNILPLVSSWEEQLLFGDIDEFKSSEIKGMESEFPLNVDIENFPSCSPEGSTGSENSPGNMRVASTPIGIIRSHKAVVKEVGRLAESLPNMRSQIDGFGAHNVHCLGHSLDSNCKLLNWTMQSKDNLSSIMSDGDKEHQLAAELPDIKDALVSGELKDIPSNPAIEISLCKHLFYEGMGSDAASQSFDLKNLELEEFTSLGPEVLKDDRLVVRINGEPSKASSPNGNWRLWPFSFGRSRSRKAMQPVLSDVRNTDAEDASEIKTGVIEAKNMLEGKVVKKLVRVLCPTSEQLASLNLKEGRNTVTFTFLTPMLGKQQVDARIYLWKWNTKIVISDVDGTITRSDVLGQFMPLVGVDWSHLGVAHLFSAIKENGYQLLFLSARAISQAYLTRQFLFNLKQDGKALPDGPVVISPDGLFPSLYREVIRRAPHEFKISCLEEIRSLFPRDFNPFYAGFGNRDTDEISYLKVGIPKGKIFIINPKGEVAVNRRLDTKSYKSLHALVNGMFPPTTSFEQEDFNSWNFWKLPPPMIDV